MNHAETYDLLTFVASYDNRRFDDATVLAWFPIFADLPFTDCRTAVTQHFATSTDYLMPAHVVRGATELDRERRRIQREQRERLALEAEAATRTDRSEETYALLAELRTSLPDPGPDVLRRKEWVEYDRRRTRVDEPNPHFEALPPPEGHPLPEPSA